MTLPAPTSRLAIAGPVMANVAFAMEVTLVPLLLAAIQLQFDLSVGDLAWVFNAYGIAMAIGILLGGWFGDAFNARRVFALGVGLFMSGSFLAAVAGSVEMLILGRGLQGFGAGIFAPLVPVLLTRAAPNRPGRTLILWGSIAGYVVAFAPLLYDRLLAAQGWSMGFLVIAGLGAMALLLAGRTAAGEAPASASRAERDLSGLLRAGTLWVTFLYVACTYGAITFYLFWLPLWLSGHEVNAASVGLVLSVLWLSFSGCSTLLRNWVDKHHVGTIMAAAPVLIAAALPLAWFNESLPLLLLSAACVGCGLACSNSPSTQMVLRFAPKGTSAFSTSLDITCARLGAITTVAILAESDPGVAATAVAILCGIALVCVRVVARAARSTE